MRIYTVHIRRAASGGIEDIHLVKEGFAWWAALFQALWALYHRHWWVAAGLFVAGASIQATLGALGYGDTLLAGLIGLTYMILVGYLAGDLRRWSLERDGYTELGVVGAPDVDAAALRALERIELAPGRA